MIISIDTEKAFDIHLWLKKTPTTTKLKTLLKVDIGASLVVQLVKNLPAMQETQVESLGWEDPMK